MLCTPLFAETTENSAADKETKTEKKEKKVTYNENGEIIKTGLNFGPLPVVAFDADRGFQYGALLNIYNFGDGSTYPNPKSWWYIEASAYTGGTWNLFLNYDNMEVWNNTRLSICTNYSNESALDFYGFNGYQSIYTYALTVSSRTTLTNSHSTLQQRRVRRPRTSSTTVQERLLTASTVTADSLSAQRPTSQERSQRTSSGRLDIHSTGSTTRNSILRDTNLSTVHSTVFTKIGES